MQRFGRFDAVSVLSQSPHATVWAARQASTYDVAGGPADHVVKRVELTPDQIAAGDSTAAQRLLVSAALQQAMGFKSVGWAPIYDTGTGGADSYYVAERFPRSAQTLIDGGRHLTSAELRTVLVAIVDALIELQVMYDRPHANLKPTNVLIGERIRAGMICLTDPAAAGDYVPSLTRAPDPRAIGRLLFALVTLRPHTAAPWPLTFDHDWQALGDGGREWFELCQSLMHPRAEASPDLDELMTRLVAIRPTWRRVRRAVKLAPVAAAVALAAYAGRAPLVRWAAAADQAAAAVLAPTPPRHGPAKPTPFNRPLVASHRNAEPMPRYLPPAGIPQERDPVPAGLTLPPGGG